MTPPLWPGGAGYTQAPQLTFEAAAIALDATNGVAITVAAISTARRFL